MSTKNLEVLWFEGMFLRPHHLQLFDRQIAARSTAQWRRLQPYSWGLAEIEIATDQLEAASFVATSLSGVLKDGTEMSLGANLRLDARDLGDALNRSEGSMTVHVGVPSLLAGEANTRAIGEDDEGRDLRHLTTTIEASDENLGGPPHTIEVRQLNGRLFFGDEPREGYATIPIAALRRSGQASNAPVLDRELIPPLVNAWAWAPLKQMVETVSKRVEAKYRYLQAEVREGRLNLDSLGASSWQAVFKLQILGAYLHVLRQLIAIPSIHPFDVYLELSRLAGELSIFEEAGLSAVKVPIYDHDNLGPCFHTLIYTVESLLEKIVSGQFIRVDFTAQEELLVAELRQEWLTGDSELYLCVQTDLSDRQLLSRLETAKIGAPTDIPLLKQRRLFGLDIELLRRTPGGLPAREELHYFAISKEGPHWEEVCHRGAMAVSGAIDLPMQFTLFIVQRPRSQPEPQED
jgi:type VI secretion system protein ImpJ